MQKLRMTTRGNELLMSIERSLAHTERELMAQNVKLGDLLYAKYGDRMGFNTDGSFSRNGIVVWPERMVSDGQEGEM